MKGRDLPDLIKAHGVERALVMMAEDLYGKHSQIKQAIVKLAQDHDRMVDLISGVMQVAENMKNETERMRRILGKDNIDA